MDFQKLKQRFSSPDFQDRLGGIGMALGGLDRGSVVDLSGVRQGIAARGAHSTMMGNEALLAQFTPDQRAMLASMPPEAARQIIAETVFAEAPAPAAPVRGVNVGGRLINPIDGTVIYQGEPDPAHRILTPEEIGQLGLPEGAYQQAPDGKITTIGGGGQNITINTGDASSQFGDAPSGTVFVYDQAGGHVMEEAPGGGQRPKTVPLGGTEAETRVTEIQDTASKSRTQATSMIATIDGLLTDPGLDSAVGAMGIVTQRMGALAPDAARVRSRIEQIQGQAFLQAFESLKGGGQITEIEGAKAEAAIARLNTAQSPDDFRAALTELKGVIQRATPQDVDAITETPLRLTFNPATGGFE